MTKANGSPKKAKKHLDTFSPKRLPGRPPTVSASAITNRANSWRGIFGNLMMSLSEAQSEDDVHVALKNNLQAFQYEGEFKPFVPMMFKVLKGTKFPKTRQAQINFLADSLAGLGLVTPRSSRDICAKERARQKRTHHIIRYEFYVACSCSYEGPSANHACPLCGAKIPEEWF